TRQGGRALPPGGPSSTPALRSPGTRAVPLRVSTCTRIGPPGSSLAPSTFTSPRPTRSSQTRVGSTSTGVLGSGWRREPSDSQGPCAALGMPQPAINPLSDPKRTFDPIAGSGGNVLVTGS